MDRGYFITIEGGEGAGKTTVIIQASAYLSSLGYEVVTSREPGGIEIAEQIRGVILDKKNTKMDGRTEALLYAAARRQHLVEKVVPSLNEGNIVLCDRFIDSSLAYQGHARGLGIKEVMAINSFAIDRFMPDLTLYLDVLPEVGLTRIHSHDQREINRLDLESAAFHQKVREGYLQLAELFADRIVTVDANQGQDEVFNQVKRALDHYLAKKKA
jgi:dTMP kinase